MNKRMFEKMMGLIVGLSLVFTGITGCQNPSRNSESSQQIGDMQDEAHEPITILTGQQQYGAFVELLEAKYPEVNLEFISFYGGDTSGYMFASLQNGEIPDIYAITYVPDSGLQKEQLLDLADYSVVNEYPTSTLDSLNVDGGIYLLPSRYSLIGIVYNKQILEENGWEVPQSFAELEELAPQIEEAGYEVMNMRTNLTGTTFGAFFALGNTNYFHMPEGAKWKYDYLAGEAKAVGSLETVTNYFQKWIDAGFINTYYYDNPNESVDIDFDEDKYVFQMYSNRMTSSDGTEQYGFMPFLSEDGSNNMLVRLVSRYYGLSKELGEKGNEQKLEDALKVLEVMATQEGQEALSGGNSAYISSTSINDLPEDSPYQDVFELINRGNMVDMVYGGWEKHIVPLITDYGNDWIDGNISSADFLKGMDTLNQGMLENRDKDKIGTATERISLEDTAKLCGIAQGKAVGADVALISMPEFHGFAEEGFLENKFGVHCGIFEGDIYKPTVDMFSPVSNSIYTVTLSGSEIKNLVSTGLKIEGDDTPFPYYMVTKNGIELEDNTEYILAIGCDELTEADIIEKAEDTGIGSKQAVIDYITELGTISVDTLNDSMKKW